MASNVPALTVAIESEAEFVEFKRLRQILLSFNQTSECPRAHAFSREIQDMISNGLEKSVLEVHTPEAINDDDEESIYIGETNEIPILNDTSYPGTRYGTRSQSSDKRKGTYLRFLIYPFSR